MKLVLIDRECSDLFKYLISQLSKSEENEIILITSKKLDNEQIKIYNSSASEKILGNCPNSLKQYEDCIIHGQKVAQILSNLKVEGYVPDIIIGSSFGDTLYVKDVFQDTPFICYFENFQTLESIAEDSSEVELNDNQKLQLTLNNAYLVPTLCACDIALVKSPKEKKQLPKDFHSKIQIISENFDSTIDIINSFKGDK